MNSTSAAERRVYFQAEFPLAEFALRRKQVAHAIGPGAVAVLAGAGETGAFDMFRQTNEFFHLCGVESPHAYLLIEGETGHSRLYLSPHDAKHERSEGAMLNADFADEARRLTGVDTISPWATLADDVRRASVIYTPFSPGEGRQASRDTLRFAARQRSADPWDRRPSAEEHFRARLAVTNPLAEIRDLSPVLDRLRLIKSDTELAVMRKAGQLTAQAVVAAMRITRPGMFEYELSAMADQVYLAGGARGPGYRSIVAGGRNIWNAHYFRNNCPLAAGDLVLMDYAPDVCCYTSDIGRMWPVQGVYSPVQRELYGFVTAYHLALLQVLRPGLRVGELAAEARALIEPTWQRWNWSKPAYQEAARVMIHSEVAFTHPVGMAVHDVGEYREAPLAPGLVFALDPQMWVQDEQIYIRVEDTVAITATGCENLTAEAPLDLDEIERIVRGGASQ